MNAYLLTPDGLPTDADLYAARCAILHSGISQSRRSRTGRARELWYNFEDGQALVSLQGSQPLEPLAIDFEFLLLRFEKSVRTFLSGVAAEPIIAQVVYERAELYFDDVVVEWPSRLSSS